MTLSDFKKRAENLDCGDIAETKAAEMGYKAGSEVPGNNFENIAIGLYAMGLATKASRCVCLGNRAGEKITDENYQFCFTTSGEMPIEFSTVMTEDEWRVVHIVLKRALLNGKSLEENKC